MTQEPIRITEHDHIPIPIGKATVMGVQLELNSCQVDNCGVFGIDIVSSRKPRPDDELFWRSVQKMSAALLNMSLQKGILNQVNA